MDSGKLFNLIAKGVMIVLIVVGVVLSYFVMLDGNPGGLSDKEIHALGTEIAKADGADKTMTQTELMNYIQSKGLEKKEEMELVLDKDVSNVIDYTKVILYIIILAVIFGMVMGLLANPKKFLISFAVGIGFVALLYIIYNGVSDAVPADLLAKEDTAILENNLTEEGRQFVPDSWRIASWAYVSTALLILTTLVVLVAGEVARIFR
jgi:hypothetical protein